VVVSARACFGPLLREARETGRVRLLACSASMVMRKLSADAVRAQVDDLVGWPTAVSLIRSAERSFVW
jgi:peroxiredoxin family protein